MVSLAMVLLAGGALNYSGGALNIRGGQCVPGPVINTERGLKILKQDDILNEIYKNK